MKVLLAGSDGFIGGELKEYFRSQNVDVFSTVFDREPERGEIRLDISSPENFQELPDTCFDAVINAAGIVDQKVPAKVMMSVNAAGVKHLATWAVRTGCRHFIQLSSIAVYGMKTLGQNRSETNTKRYNGIFAIPYMRSKARAERYIERTGLPCTVLRLPSVIGAGDSFVTPTIAARIVSDTFFFSGSGKKLVSLLYVKNLGPLLLKLIKRGPQNRAYNCSDFHVPWEQLIAEYARTLKRKFPDKWRSVSSLVFNMRNSGASMLYTFSYFGSHFPGDRLHRLLEFEPPFDWRQGVREGVDVYLASLKQ